MSSMDLVLSEKYKAFLKCQTPVEFLEGTTAAGKTTVGIFKFMLKVAQSPKKLHIHTNHCPRIPFPVQTKVRISYPLH